MFGSQLNYDEHSYAFVRRICKEAIAHMLTIKVSVYVDAKEKGESVTEKDEKIRAVLLEMQEMVEGL